MRKFILLKNEFMNCLYTLLNPMYLLIIIATVLSSISMDNESYVDLLFISFTGPCNLTSNIMLLLTWLLHQTFIFYLIGNYLNQEINERYVYKITRIESRTIWIINKFIHIFILILLYYLIMFSVILCIGYIIYNHNNSFGLQLKGLLLHSGYIDINPHIILLNLFCLILLTTFLLSIIQTLSILLSRHQIFSLILIEILLILSVGIDTISIRLGKFFPSNHGIFLKHNITNFKLSFSYLYLSLFILLFIFICSKCIKKIEI